MSNKSKLKHLDVFTRIDADVGRGMDVSKSWDKEAFFQQELMNEIDMAEQRRCGGIKPMSEQFPGEEWGTSDLDINEADRITRKKQLLSDVVEHRMQKKTKKLSARKDAASCVAVMCGSELLMGKRRDSGKWTCPGGHLDQGESAEAGALRELFEETGIKAPEVRFLTSKKISTPDGEKLVSCYEYLVTNKPDTTSENDPDNEVAKWEWIDVSKGLPAEVAIELAHPKNILLQHLGLQK